MEGNIDIYCELGFIDQFCNSCPPSKNGIPDKHYKSWQKYLDLLCGQSDVVLMDITTKEYSNYCDDSIRGQIFDILLKSHFDGNGNLICLPEEQKNMEIKIKDDEGKEYFNQHEHAIFLMNGDKSMCTTMEEDYGLLFISPETMYERAEFLFTPQRNIINETTNNWEFVRNYRLPYNSILLIDNFILSKDYKDIEKNFISLFNALLPDKLNKNCAHISILTEIPKKQDEKWANEKKTKIEELIKSVRNYSIEVTIKYTKNENHDRNLITNYHLFDCGYGFVLSDLERRKGTKLTAFPITHPSTLLIIQQLKEKFRIE